MTGALLVVALANGVAAVVIGLPAWLSYRRREARDLNAERYLTWRGRAAGPGASLREGMTGAERRRIWIGAALGIVAAACLIIGLSSG
ncbi:MAG: hypothetical protein ACRDFR_04095 [Candidatus Limnocylindria bacterium]